MYVEYNIVQTLTTIFPGEAYLKYSILIDFSA